MNLFLPCLYLYLSQESYTKVANVTDNAHSAQVTWTGWVHKRILYVLSQKCRKNEMLKSDLRT